MVKIENPYRFRYGDAPLLVSMPHSGTALLPGMADRLTDDARPLPDTDWYMPELYGFLSEMGVSVIDATYSRMVVDLNRPVDDKPLYATKTTGLFPDILFADKPVFKPGQSWTEAEKVRIKADIWHPYHQKIADELDRIKARYGYALLFDAHSIAAQVPMLFDGTLPDFNFGTNDGNACDQQLSDVVTNIVTPTHYSHVVNGRFKGGYITRIFGQPQDNVHAIQLELSQATYLAETHDYRLDVAKTEAVSRVLHTIIRSLLDIGDPSIHSKRSGGSN